jgi:signal transduction histidine kinase
MPHLARGAALVDPDGLLLAADPGFREALGLAVDAPPQALRDLAGAEPSLLPVLTGAAPASAEVAGPFGLVTMERTPAACGALLVLRGRGDPERLGQSVSAAGMSRVAGGLSHDVKNGLNAMALQLALLEEKVGEGEVARATAGHLAALHDQVAKVNEVLRRFCDVVDPSTSYAWVDLGADLQDIAGLFGHDFRRRRIAFELEAPRGVVWATARPERAMWLLLGIFGRAAARTPEGGRLSVRVATGEDGASVVVDHAIGALDLDLRYDTEVAAAAVRALGGALEVTREGGQERVVIRLPRGSQP